MKEMVRVFVHPRFKKQIKTLAAELDCSMLEATKNGKIIINNEPDIEHFSGWKYQKRPKYEFKV